jgi:hypothetical protein
MAPVPVIQRILEQLQTIGSQLDTVVNLLQGLQRDRSAGVHRRH